MIWTMRTLLYNFCVIKLCSKIGHSLTCMHSICFMFEVSLPSFNNFTTDYLSLMWVNIGLSYQMIHLGRSETCHIKPAFQNSLFWASLWWQQTPDKFDDGVPDTLRTVSAVTQHSSFVPVRRLLLQDRCRHETACLDNPTPALPINQD